MGKPQFSTRDLFWAMTNLGGGLRLLATVWQIGVQANSLVVACEACVGGPALMGAGGGLLFRAKTVGGIVGTMVGAFITPSTSYHFAPWLSFP